MLHIDENSALAKIARGALPALLAGLFCWYNIWLRAGAGSVEIKLFRLNYGSALLAGLRNDNITWMMPFFETVFSFAVNSGLAPLLLLVLLHLGIYLLVFCAGALLRGYRAGLGSLAAAGLLDAAGVFRYDDEQAFYAFFLLLALSLLLIKRRDNTLRNNVLCGLALGASLLVRTPLVLFPPALVLLDWFYARERSRAFFIRALALLAASYVLLLPWGYLNYSVSGKFSAVDDRRGACNLITAAKGSVYTMEGDCRRLAGLGAGDSALGFYARSAVKSPAAFGLNFLKRLWHIFLFYPLLFGLFLLAAALSRWPDKLLVFSLPAYFILVHAALSIEERYFYPLLYLLPPLAVGSLLSRRAGGAPARSALAEQLTAAAFWISFCAVLAVEALVTAYPYRSARHLNDREYLYKAIERFPEDRALQDIKCRRLWARGEDAAYAACLAANSRKFGDRAGEYFLAVSASTVPAALPIPQGREMECLILRMLREFELGDRPAGVSSFKQAFAAYEAAHSMLRGEPYHKDKELALQLKGNAAVFWDDHVYPALLLRPPKAAAKALTGLKETVGLPEDSKPRLLQEVLALGGPGEAMLRKRAELDMFGLPPSDMRLFWIQDGKGSKELSDEAVKKILGGDLAGAKKILLKAAALNPSDPEVFSSLCHIYAREKNKSKALASCQGAAYSVYFNPENKLPPLETLAADASLESYELLRGLGRNAEAKAVLLRAVRSAPAGWPGLPKARAALSKLN